ncbi:MAG: class I SAM-dependent methyltransferase [Lentilitoribacter sp.]
MKTKLSKLYSDPELAKFYEVNDHDRLDYETILELAKDARSVLDIGCGTGVLSAALSINSDVTAVDPARAMLEIAKRNFDQTNVEWIEGDAREVRLARKFDFIVMSGHAFQVFLDEQDQLSVLKTIAEHLADCGTFIFDSRNPFFPESKERTRQQTYRKFQHSKLGEVHMWNESSFDEESGILTYTNGFSALGERDEKSAQERIKYTPKSELDDLLSKAGLEILSCFGSWNKEPFHNQAREIIIVGGLEKHHNTKHDNERS